VLLPTLLTDLLFAGKEPDAEVTVLEGNPAMQEVLAGYGEKVIRHAGIGGEILVTGDMGEALEGADCVIYAGDPQAASRFFMDRNALGSDDEVQASIFRQRVMQLSGITLHHTYNHLLKQALEEKIIEKTDRGKVGFYRAAPF
jgi:hypothetical protein